MISAFYGLYGRKLLLFIVLSLPFLAYHAETVPSNNDIETWLPEKLDARSVYEEFKREFGADEVILVGLAKPLPSESIIESLRQRIERITGVRECWSPHRLRSVMLDMDVSLETAERRIRGLLIAHDQSMIGLLAVLSDHGLQHRTDTVREVREQLAYCQLSADRVSLGGSPVVIAELDRLGSRRNGKPLFLATLCICLVLLVVSIRDFRLSLSILGITIWAIELTLAAIKVPGGEMNFILNALPVLVMVFTITISIHVVHYYRSSLHLDDALTTALQLAWKPCCLAIGTTAIGLLSLGVSDMAPVRVFGYTAAFGSVVSLFAGLCLTPAILTVLPAAGGVVRPRNSWFRHSCDLVLSRPVLVAACASILIIVTAFGLPLLDSHIDPLDFLPASSRIRSDSLRLEDALTSSSSVETVIDFAGDGSTFIDRLERVRQIQQLYAEHPAVRHTLSLADFVPPKLPDSPFEAAGWLSRANARRHSSAFLADDTNLWRISTRLYPSTQADDVNVATELRTLANADNVAVTGVAPLLDFAQRSIFVGFWKSFSTAFVIITAVMIVSLRSLKAGCVAMIPNVTPICLVFGTLGWLRLPVDIGMMMTGSIAVGLAVDGTFHYLLHYYRLRDADCPLRDAARMSLYQTGMPILVASVVSAVGMLALAFSSFLPTARFGCLMAILLIVAAVGDLVVLPCFLSIGVSPAGPATPSGAPAVPRFLTVARKDLAADAVVPLSRATLADCPQTVSNALGDSGLC